MTSTPLARGVWSTSEHERFLEAVALYPQGPWQLITAYVGTRSAKQVQTHAQKYQHKLLRHRRGLRKYKTKTRRPEHRVDAATAEQLSKGCVLRTSQPKHEALRPPEDATWTSDTSGSEYSECFSDYGDVDAMPDAIEPIPFRSTRWTSDETWRLSSEHDDRDLCEALDWILAMPPLVEVQEVCV